MKDWTWMDGGGSHGISCLTDISDYLMISYLDSTIFDGDIHMHTYTHEHTHTHSYILAFSFVLLNGKSLLRLLLDISFVFR